MVPGTECLTRGIRPVAIHGLIGVRITEVSGGMRSVLWVQGKLDCLMARGLRLVSRRGSEGSRPRMKQSATSV